MTSPDRNAIARDVAERLASAIGNGAKPEAFYNGRAFRITSTSKLLHEYPVEVSLSTERGSPFSNGYRERPVRGVTISVKIANYRVLWSRTRKTWTDSQITMAAEFVQAEYDRRHGATRGLQIYEALVKKCDRLPGLYLEPRAHGVEITLIATTIEQIRAVAAAFASTGGLDDTTTPDEE